MYVYEYVFEYVAVYGRPDHSFLREILPPFSQDSPTRVIRQPARCLTPAPETKNFAHTKGIL